jgi:hypothetical protein
MISPTPIYEEMKVSLRDAKALVAGVGLLECATNLQHLKLQGYILIVHSILEEYLEKLCRAAALKARKTLADDGKITKALVALIATSVVEKISEKGKKKVTTDLASNLTIFSIEATNTFIIGLKNNHGITTNDQNNLLLPIGVDLEKLDIGLSQNLNIFGRNRGLVAHTFKLQREDTLSDVQSRIENIVRDLAVLDCEVCEVCSLAV